MRRSMTHCSMSEISEQGLCTSSIETTQMMSFTDERFSQNANVCKIEYTHFGEFYVCTLCNVKCTGRKPFLQHIYGSVHKRNSNSNTFFGNECNANLNSLEQYVPHCNGLGHERNVLPSSERLTSGQGCTQQGSVGDNDASYFCTPCSLQCSSKKQLDCHLLGRKHVRRCSRQTAYSPVQRSDNVVLQSQSNQLVDLVQDFSQMHTSMESAVGNSNNSTNAEMVPFIRKITELESRLISTTGVSLVFSSLSFCSLPPCQQQMDTDDAVRASLQQSTCDSYESEHFCRHTACVLVRSLQFYEKSLCENLGDRD
ncbi:unnamed protein product [Heterobilharzia americana]|nr:unnamed protein product [Heterobilharzia americana]